MATKKFTAAQREERFVVSYLKSLDATAAATEVGLKNPKQAGHVYLHRPRVRAQIEREQAKQVARVGMDAERIKREIYALATLDPGECFDPVTGMPRQIKDLPPHVRACIREVDMMVSAEGHVRSVIRFWDKPKALALAAQHLRLLAPTEVNVHHRFEHAHLSDAELQQKLLDAAHSLQTG
jgi:hypothetical protein